MKNMNKRNTVTRILFVQELGQRDTDKRFSKEKIEKHMMEMNALDWELVTVVQIKDRYNNNEVIAFDYYWKKE